MARASVGKAINRLEGKAKVTGSAKYSGEYNVPDLLYGYVVNSRITKGKIRSIDTTKAKAVAGVVEIFTHENRPKLPWLNLKYKDLDSPKGSAFKPLHDSEIKFNGQPIALVVAKDFETARYASTQVSVQYEEELLKLALRRT
jgi:xanthine dehydrogenase YagR molybdenum-binding subunit